MGFVKTRVILPEKVDQYFSRCKEIMEIKMIHTSLAGKAEPGSNRSEKGYQLTAASTCRQMARVLKCNEEKAEALSLIVGQYFPKYGMAGVGPVKEYIVKNNIELDPEDLAVDMTEYVLAEQWGGVATVMDALIRQYFSGDDSDPEVRLVRFVQRVIREVKIAEHYFDGQPGDLLFDVCRDIIKLAEETGELTPGRILENYREQIDNYQLPVLTEEQRQKVFEEIDLYIKDFCGNTGEKEIFNVSREEAILIYMQMAT